MVSSPSRTRSYSNEMWWRHVCVRVTRDMTRTHCEWKTRSRYSSASVKHQPSQPKSRIDSTSASYA